MDLDHAIAAAGDAVEASSRLRVELRRKFPPDRDRRLHAQMNALSRVREPLRRHLLHAPKWGMFYAPEVRAASNAITRERRRLDRMLNGKPGRAGWQSRATPPTVRVAELRRKLDQLRGTVNQAEGKLREFHGTLEAITSVAAGQLPVGMRFEVRRDANAIASSAREARLRIASRQQRLKASVVFGPRAPRGLDAVDAKAERIKRELQRCERVAARIAKSVPSGPVKPREWTWDTAIDALDEWAAHNEGYWPAARDLTKYRFLPSRGTLGNLGISLVRDCPRLREWY